MKNEPQRRIDQYNLLEQIGKGGMAVVYKAMDLRHDRLVALKLIRLESFNQDNQERLRKRFEREASVMARLDHPHIVNVFDYGEFQGQPYLVMEYLSGKTLKDLSKPMVFTQAAKILAPVASALAHAHDRHVLHRDVKPANILISSNGEPKLADFGIAKLLDIHEGSTLTGTGLGVGTPEYMSPEQSLGKDVDARTALYALGVVFYELVTGRKPFEADTPMATLYQQMNDPVPRPTALVPGLPKAVESVLLKALAKQPEARFSDMGVFEGVLKRFAQGDKDDLYSQESESATFDVLEPSPHLPDDVKPQKPTRRPFGWIFAIVAGLILVLGVGTIMIGLLISSGSLFSKPADSVPPTTEVAAATPAPEMSTEGEPFGVTAEVQSPTSPSARPEALDPDVIQLANAAMIQEVAHWENVKGDLITWLPSGDEVILGDVLKAQGIFVRLNLSTGEMIDISRQYADAGPNNWLYPWAISSDGSVLAAANYGNTDLFFWQIEDPDPFFGLSGEFWSAMLHQPPAVILDDLAYVVVDDSLQVWDLRQQAQVVVLDQSFDWDTYFILQPSSDSTALAMGDQKNGGIKIWDLAANELISTPQWHPGLNHLAFSPDGMVLASAIGVNYGRRDIIRLWDVQTGTLLNVIQKSNEDVHSMTFAQDGQILVTGNGVGEIRFWNVQDGDLIHTIYTGNENSVYLISISPDGKQLLTVNSGGARLWAINIDE